MTAHDYTGLAAIESISERMGKETKEHMEEEESLLG